MQDIKFGPEISNGATTFRLWAPLQEQIALKIAGRNTLEMRPERNGWHVLEVSDTGPGTVYSFVLRDGLEVPDPASRFQPADVHGPSEVIDPGYAWGTVDWKGRPWEEMVIYEIHVGAFTQEGTFLAAIDHLDHLKHLGVTAIQIMPIGAFPGRWNWGYDGVQPYAPDRSYGRPEDLKALVDAAHAHGICVFLDVVYNHFGPDGNYMSAYAPIFTDKHQTPWGNGVNYDGEDSDCVREFVVQNAIYWVSEFKLDGLRLDAVHAIDDDRDRHILHELADRVRACASDRHVHLIVENEDNDAALLARDEDGRPRHFTAQWNDDIHHVLHIAATGETFGYYQDYADDPEKLGRALAEGFVFQGEHMPYRGETRGTPSAGLPPTAFISFIQNHDQIGNRAIGDRMSVSQSRDRLKAIAAIYLLAPQIPMLFMGEEWGAREPFPYFCDFDADMNEKVRQGRREELGRLPGFDADDSPDPTAESTFRSAKLRWGEEFCDVDFLQDYRTLIALRRDCIIPLLREAKGQSGTSTANSPVISVEWTMGSTKLRLLANLSDTMAKADTAKEAVVILTVGWFDSDTLGPWTVVWSVLNDETL